MLTDQDLGTRHGLRLAETCIRRSPACVRRM